MSKSEEKMIEALERFSVATASVSLVAQMLVMTESETYGVRADVFEDLRGACAEMREAQQALESAQEALVVDMMGESLEGRGEGGMAS